MISHKHELFGFNYVHNGNNAKKAYMRVYPTSKESTAEVNATKLLKRPEIKAFIESLQEKIREEHMMSIQQRQSLLSKIALGIEEETKVIYKDEIPVREGLPASLKTRMEALDLLNKMEGVYSQNVNLNATGSLSVTTKQEWAKELLDEVMGE